MFWTEAMYGTGDATVDEQHRVLFDLINSVLECLEKKSASDIFEAKWGAMVDYTKSHFACEEDIMEKKKCSACDANKKAHHAFLNLIGRLHEKYRVEGATDEFAGEFYKFVASWLRSHIMLIDATLKQTA